MFRNLLSLLGAGVQSLVKEIRSCKLHGTANEEEEQNGGHKNGGAEMDRGYILLKIKCTELCPKEASL